MSLLIITTSIKQILALMLLAFTMGRMVRSVHLTLSPIRLADQFDFTASDRYSYEKIHTASLVTARWTDLSTRHQGWGQIHLIKYKYKYKYDVVEFFQIQIW